MNWKKNSSATSGYNFWNFFPGQALLHTPQCCALTFVFVSQPFEALPSQLSKPMLHTGWQLEPSHDVVPF